jgi:hypothetical protein
MTYINWDKQFLFEVDSIAFPVPTYGNYGGPLYSAGEFGGQLETKKNGKPLSDQQLDNNVDALDYLFYRHDVEDGANGTAADLALIRGISKLSDEQLADPEASLYAGLTTLTFSVLLLEDNPLLAVRLIPYIHDALENIITGLAGLEPAELTVALTWLTGSFDNPEAGVVDILADANLSEPINGILDFADIYLDALNGGFPVAALSSYDFA